MSLGTVIEWRIYVNFHQPIIISCFIMLSELAIHVQCFMYTNNIIIITSRVFVNYAEYYFEHIRQAGAIEIYAGIVYKHNLK